jgi:hypothetical protein
MQESTNKYQFIPKTTRPVTGQNNVNKKLEGKCVEGFKFTKPPSKGKIKLKSIIAYLDDQ